MFLNQDSMTIENFKKPSNPFWKSVGDTILYAQTLIQPAIMGSPLKDSVKLWTVFVVSMLAISVKLATKFTANE